MTTGPSGRAVWGVGLDRLDAETVGSNPAYGMNACLCVMLSCVLSGLASGWSPFQGVLPIVETINNYRK
jgi:hypothetical protein